MRRMHDDKEVVSSVKVEDNNLIVENAAGNVNTFLIQGGGAVDSVNGKTGEVVLTADDIMVQNATSVQSNLERIDLEVEGLVDDVADLNTGKLDASKQAVSDVGGLVIPTAAPANDVLVGISADREQKNISIGDNLTLADGVLSATSGGSDYTFTNGLTEADGTVSNTLYSNIRVTSTGGVTCGSKSDLDANKFSANSGNFVTGRAYAGNIYSSSGYGNITGADMSNSIARNNGRGCLLMGSGNYGEIEISQQAHGSAYIGETDNNATAGKGYIAHDNSQCFGKNLRTGAHFQTVIGKNNLVVSDKAFVIGNGASATNRSNVFTIGYDGAVTIGGTTLTEAKLQTLVATKVAQFVTINFTAGSTGGGVNEHASVQYVHNEPDAKITSLGEGASSIYNKLKVHMEAIQAVDYAHGLPLINGETTGKRLIFTEGYIAVTDGPSSPITNINPYEFMDGYTIVNL